VGQLVLLHQDHKVPVTAVHSHCDSTADSVELCVLSSSTPCVMIVNGAAANVFAKFVSVQCIVCDCSCVGAVLNTVVTVTESRKRTGTPSSVLCWT
jgi:hypothetical protein